MTFNYTHEYVLIGDENQRPSSEINQGKSVFYQGSRQMTNISRRYYEHELGAGLGPSPSMKEHFGYSEPLRRFIQRESFEPQANEIPNTMPSWLPGDDYMTNFKVGDPYVRLMMATHACLEPVMKRYIQSWRSQPRRLSGHQQAEHPRRLPPRLQCRVQEVP